MNRKLIKTLSLIIAASAMFSLSGCTININDDMIPKTTSERENDRHNRKDEDDDDDRDDDNDRDSDNEANSENNDSFNDNSDAPTSQDTNEPSHDPNAPVVGTASLEDQIAVFVANRSVWEITESSDTDYYAITDFDNDGHYEILCVTTGGSGRYTYTKLYEINNECTGVYLVTEFIPEYANSNCEIDWFNSDYNYSRLADGTYCYEVFNNWSAGATSYGAQKIELSFTPSGVTTAPLGSWSCTDDVFEYFDANRNPVSEYDYDIAFDSTMLSGTTFGSIHIEYTRDFYSSSPFSSVSDSELTTLLETSANGFQFFVG